MYSPSRMEQSMSESNNELLDFCRQLDNAEYWHVPLELLKSFEDKLPGINFEYLGWALGYYMPLDIDSDRDAFIPAFEFEEGSYPPKLNTLSSEVLEVWSELLALLDDSMSAKARLSDLLWFFEYSNEAHTFAEIASAAYLEIEAHCDWSNIYKSVVLARSWRISNSIGHSQLISNTENAITQLIDTSLSSAVSEPGVVLPMIELLLSSNRSDGYSILEEFISRAEAKFQDNPFILDEVLLLRSVMTPGKANQDATTMQRIKTWEAAALDAQGFVAILHLQKAISIARDSKLVSEMDRLTLLLEELAPIATTHLQEFSSKISLEQVDIKKLLETFTANPTMLENLERVASEVPIEDRVSLDEDYLKELMAQYPLRFLINKVILHPGGLPLVNLNTPRKIAEHDLELQELNQTLFWSQLLILIIENLAENPELFLNSVYLHLSASELLSKEDVNNFMASFRHYVNSKFGESIYVVIPRIERVLRNLVEAQGMTVFIEKDRKGFGSFITLGDILHKLKSVGNLRFWNYANNLLNNRFQLNLRNNYLHGLVDIPQRMHAVLLLHFVLQLAIIRIEPSRN